MKPRDNNPNADFYYDAQGRRRVIPGGNNLSTAHQPKKTETSLYFKPEILSEFRHLAQGLKRQENAYRANLKKGLDSVDSVQVLSEKAAKLTQNNPAQFIKLMNEVLLGSDTTVLGIDFISPRKQPRIEFGDLGFNPDYRDKTPIQTYSLLGLCQLWLLFP